ncbi:MAG: UDP-3-O-(3-hydroxymyristoyl)glucosamine N-acyltransferase [Phycisphaerales bacterium]|nr:UDP-3-O-(3-hydroxymyristoyl)glucosamine N-acyltransferase [Phycisphaerales bacterium]
MAYPLHTLADYLSKVGMTCTVDGNENHEVLGVATLEDATSDEISFLANPKYESALQSTSAGAVIVSEKQTTPKGMSVLRTANPYAAVMAVMVHIHGYRKHKPAVAGDRAVIDASAVIGENANIHHGVTIEANATIGRNVVIYPGVYIAENCRLGDDCILYPNVVLYDGTVLGHRVTIHAGSIIGEDGLGYAPVGEKWHKIPQIGTVDIGDDVEIGANCAIDRATLGRTVIASGTKFSNLIAIGHGTKVGENCMFVAQVGLAGSVNVGKHVTMAGKVGVAGHLNIGDNAELGAMSGVMKDVPANTRVAGAPALPIKDAMRSISLFEKLPQLHKQIKTLESEVEKLRLALKDNENE